MIRLVVEGRPAPKGSRIQARSKTGKSYTRPASKYEAPWTRAVKEAAMQAMRHSRDLEPPYRVELEFVLDRPVRPRCAWPTASDLDKLERCVLDGLVQGKVLSDDRHVCALTSSKRWRESDERQGVIVTVSELRKLQGLPVAA